MQCVICETQFNQSILDELQEDPFRVPLNTDRTVFVCHSCVVLSVRKAVLKKFEGYCMSCLNPRTMTAAKKSAMQDTSGKTEVCQCLHPQSDMKYTPKSRPQYKINKVGRSYYQEMKDSYTPIVDDPDSQSTY